jgi:drug/metabolite transporter (DMT)-like permease
LLWAVDNNLTRNVSASDAVFLAMVKGLVAGVFNVSLAFVLGASMTNVGAVGLTLVVGFLGYGISLVLFILALRYLGTARTGAHFATAPFFGSALAILFLGEPLSVQFLLGFALMSGATYLVLTERHAHMHTHEPMVHTHEHVHDMHHQHAHTGVEGPEPHTHPHAHEALTHSHEHLPDLHHRHGH